MKVAKSQKAFLCLNLKRKELNQLEKSFSTFVIFNIPVVNTSAMRQGE